MKEKTISNKIPQYVLRVAKDLKDNGFKAFLVGGAVRDLYLDIIPNDFDIATDANPDQMVKIFPRSVSINAKFGTILVIVEDENKENFDIEVTTFRKEENYFGGRWPSKVEFTKDINQDLSRRDFTINAMAIDLTLLIDEKESREVLIDPFLGRQDLDDRVIRAVRDPLERFSEDGLRSFRACRLASELNFTIEKETFKSIKKCLMVSKMVSIERIRDEFQKLIMKSPKPSRGINLLYEAGLLELFLPELILCKGITQPEWHSDDLYDHSLKVLDRAEDSVKIAGLFHDIGKTKTRTVDKDGKVHFFGHDQIGAEMTREILNRLKFSKLEVNRVINLIKWHMFYYPSADWRKEKELNKIEEEKGRVIGGWTDSAIRRFIKNVGGENLDDLFKLRIADASSNSKSQFNNNEIKALQKRISEVKEKEMVLKVEDLALDGFDLISLGIKPGPEIGSLLDKLLNIVIEDPMKNNKEELTKELKLLTNILRK